MALIRVERRGETAVLVFARPPVNAFNLPFLAELDARIGELVEDVPAGGVVVTGDGGAFSGGVDFKEVPGYSASERAQTIGHINAMVAALYGLPAATVAAVNGHAIGGAFVVMLACDTRLLAAGDARLGLTEVTAGIPYPACAMEVVKAELEPGIRRHLVMSGELIDPARALANGIADELVSAESLVARAVELARERSRARSYAVVKRQLKGETLARMREIIDSSRDPMLEHWL